VYVLCPPECTACTFFVKSVHEIVADKLTGIARSKSLTVKFNMDCGTRNPLDRSIFD